MILDREAVRPCVAWVPPQQNEALPSPLSLPSLPSPLSSPVPGLLCPHPLTTMGGLLHKGAIFSASFFLLLDSEVWTTGSPTSTPEYTRGLRLGVPSPFCQRAN